MAPYHLCQYHPRCIFLSGFPTKIWYDILICRTRTKYPAHIILIELITLIRQCLVDTNYEAAHYPAVSSLLLSSLSGPDVLLSTWLPSIISQSPYLEVRDNVHTNQRRKL